MRNEIKGVLTNLKLVQAKVEGFLAKASDNEAWEEKLSNELDSIAEAIEALENIE